MECSTFRVVENNVGIMCSCFPAMSPLIRSVRQFVGSNTGPPRQARSNSSRHYNWFSSSKEKGTPLSDASVRLTLGSPRHGNGHFPTMRNHFFMREDEQEEVADISMQDQDIGVQTNIRSSLSRDPELGFHLGVIRVETEVTST